MAGDAELVEGDDAVVTVVLAAGRDAAEQVGDFGKLRDAWGDAREGVGGVVDDDRDGELVESGIAEWMRTTPSTVRLFADKCIVHYSVKQARAQFPSLSAIILAMTSWPSAVG